MRTERLADGPDPETHGLVVIASAGHSGSTLLDLLLGNHSLISGIGEMNRLTLYPGDRACACGETIEACRYWKAVRLALGHAARHEGARWSEYHTDLPPQRPLLTIDAPDDGWLAEGALHGSLRESLEAAGLKLGRGAVLVRGGTRDVKTRLVDKEADRTYVLRREAGSILVYEPLRGWKNPLRIVPDAIEIAVATGSVRLARVMGRVSPLAARHLEAGANSWRVVDAIAAVDGTRFVVDSSKSAVRMKLLYMLRPKRVRIINLVRDGRAVAASAMRRNGIDAASAARIWKRENQHLAAVLRTVPNRAIHQMRYERLCEDPAGELTRACHFLGMDFEPGMLALWDREIHSIPGNPMLFQKSRRTITKDERWRRELSAGDLAAFERVAGSLNRSFGRT